MRRRAFIALLGGMAATWSVAARARQAGKVWLVGILSPGSSGQTDNLRTFMQGLNDLGYVDGKNILLERRVADGNVDRLPALAAELIRIDADIILAESSFAVEAARATTKTIPIVMIGVGNAVGSGFVSSVSRPGGNITGLTNDSIEVSSKYLEYLRAAVPAMHVGVLIDPKHPNHPTVLKQIQVTAQTIGASISAIELRSVSDIDAALRSVQQDHLDALIVPPDPTFPIIYRQITEFAISNRLPTMFGQRRGVEAGGLMGYEPNVADMYKRAAALVDKILKGAKPADLPVEFPTRFEFIINLKTAKALGLTVPPALLTSADELID
jgi:putative ABC transport system substrate-binding protein